VQRMREEVAERPRAVLAVVRGGGRDEDAVLLLRVGPASAAGVGETQSGEQQPEDGDSRLQQQQQQKIDKYHIVKSLFTV